ncbi:hypothetical protein JCM16303_006173 [Sporobolomyces ruberrimus]
MVQNNSLNFVKAVPADQYPVPGEHTKLATGEIDLDQSLENGSILVKTKVLSLDPYQRSRLRNPGTKSYVPEFELNKPLTNFGVGEVIKAGEGATAKKGDLVYGNFDFAEYVVFPKEAASQLRIFDNKEKLPLSTWVGAAGMPGQTAYVGLRDIGKPKKGETIFVSSASGAVGQMVIGLAHKAGLKVIAAAGSDEKVKLLQDTFKVEHAFNYKTTDIKEYLSQHEYQLFWDNVAGETLEAVLQTIQTRGRIIGCGAASSYNSSDNGVKGMFNVVAKELHYEGFIVLNRDIGSFYDEIPSAISKGELIKPVEHITKGLDNGEAFLELLQGGNVGKSVVVFE